MITMLLLMAVCAFAAENFWYVSYENGVAAFELGQLEKAEANFQLALKAQPVQGKRIKAYGTKFLRYIPDYYLGVIHLRRGQYKEALDQFERVKKAKLIGPGDREYADMLHLVQVAEDQMKPAVTPDKHPQEEASALVQKARGLIEKGQLDEARNSLKLAQEKDPVNSSIANLFAQIAQKEAELNTQLENTQQQEQQKAKQQFELLLRDADRAISAKDYGKARDLTRQASVLGIDALAVQESFRRIDAAEKSAALPAVPEKAKTDNEEVQALVAFYSGDYSQSIALLERVASRKDSARVHFYLGCSHAALGLLQGKKGQAALQQSKDQFAQTRRMDPKFQYDSLYISPRILQLYRQ